MTYIVGSKAVSMSSRSDGGLKGLGDEHLSEKLGRNRASKRKRANEAAEAEKTLQALLERDGRGGSTGGKYLAALNVSLDGGRDKRAKLSASGTASDDKRDTKRATEKEREKGREERHKDQSRDESRERKRERERERRRRHKKRKERRRRRKYGTDGDLSDSSELSDSSTVSESSVSSVSSRRSASDDDAKHKRVFSAGAIQRIGFDPTARSGSTQKGEEARKKSLAIASLQNTERVISLARPKGLSRSNVRAPPRDLTPRVGAEAKARHDARGGDDFVDLDDDNAEDDFVDLDDDDVGEHGFINLDDGEDFVDLDEEAYHNVEDTRDHSRSASVSHSRNASVSLDHSRGLSRSRSRGHSHTPIINDSHDEDDMVDLD